MSRSGIWACVPAAGSGARMQSSIPKQYLPLLDRPVLWRTLERLCSCQSVAGVMVGHARVDPRWPSLEALLGGLKKPVATCIGGARRADTVLNMLKALAGRASDDDWVMVHDAVRPCVRVEDIDRLVREAGRSADGGLLALPVADTVKRTDSEGRVTETVPRAGLWRALTPQMFRLGRLREALEKTVNMNVEITDEAMAIELTGGRPLAVAGHPDNIKITHPGDLVLAELYLKQQS
ncbi:MAG: 2-C-methyl-D-erythritol 4-phosphate cytidylyltransferase [Candidatus Muproteobacteria bacterium RBG_16_62_13]|uniref:2-C-methyl-D-erythritol 4-phosphate cytidylyltransferase n=1 Tax=Candidatus Muproteobacteria bacterium RBG_16_62_13 TaxID=1817756 RepID=A0A1F6SZ05_9PROT|nr:MAG: 2-C-methyl-D-erythritol 4-phosphate cytidylyltransferase [Candidatus Muproteobacteria bacterium RBG_16_62_13]